MDVPIAANVLGTLGAVCWSIQLIPQIVVNWRRHHAIGLQPTMMMLWAWAGVPLGVYNIVEEYNIALRIQPQLLTFLSLVTWIQCYYYEKNWTLPRSLLTVTPIALLMSAVQTALILALRIAKHDRGLQWPLTLMAVLSATLLAAGVGRHYYDIYVHRTVRGISFLFVGIDALGDVFSLAAVVFQRRLDVLGLVIYGTELVLWIGVFACGGYYNFVPWVRGRLGGKKVKSAGEGGGGSIGCRRSGDGEDVGGMGNTIALHDLPSSTSVFRTPAGEVDVMRQRTRGSGRSRSQDGMASSA
ncbi:PQ loop repeat protein [Aaosphaeria arxii CBS 175.79]|uniref:PQ loop repeat protein n=1 Tax=Aaosphaeria arxii CBS 175.79 TaxID=1450172 RepID=A0A6A5XGX8_9PLEO|nr:PQ loop repeat protein [Aaosphaeria arxii CBS 175.79]KAF2012342.1 PQ loop repeat protein [Aaosphaeria arxii CBS 175.79]